MPFCTLGWAGHTFATLHTSHCPTSRQHASSTFTGTQECMSLLPPSPSVFLPPGTWSAVITPEENGRWTFPGLASPCIISMTLSPCLRRSEPRETNLAQHPTPLNPLFTCHGLAFIPVAVGSIESSHGSPGIKPSGSTARRANRIARPALIEFVARNSQ